MARYIKIVVQEMAGRRPHGMVHLFEKSIILGIKIFIFGVSGNVRGMTGKRIHFSAMSSSTKTTQEMAANLASNERLSSA